MHVNFKVKTLDAQTHEFGVDNEMTVREFKTLVAGKTNIAADQQRIIYCGRVLADERQLKDFDLEGKVVHVAERPPPSQREPSAERNGRNVDGMNGAFGIRPPRMMDQINMRNLPIFRALDDMMNNGQTTVNALTSSSSFSMNRITVARHMLDCANNIAAYLEDPSRGLNNTPLDIFTRGRWTMESTVVEVGITTTEIPQNQIAEMVQGAVNAALLGNANANVTVVQLPNVFGLAGDGASNAAAGGVSDEPGNGAGANSGASTNSAIDGPTVGATPSATAGAGDETNRPSTQTTGTNTDDVHARRRTGTGVLADVILHMRNVQTRLQPFLEQFHQLLRDDPNFGENDNEERERAQRLYNGVSEALHYMSHAQHAMSDLMLDMSLPTPRFLTCHPILVEQSGYNYNISPVAAGLRQAQQNATEPTSRPRAAGRPSNPESRNPSDTSSGQEPHVFGRPISSESRNRGCPLSRSSEPPSSEMHTGSGAGHMSHACSRPSNATAGTNSTSSTPSTAGPTGDDSGNSLMSHGSTSSVDDPVGDIILSDELFNNAVPDTAPVAEEPQQPNVGNRNVHVNPNMGNDSTPNATAGVPQALNGIQQMHMARLLQAVMNSAPLDTEVHVQINAPSIVSIGVPARGIVFPTGSGTNASATAPAPAATASTDQPQATGEDGERTNSSGGTGAINDAGRASAQNQPRVISMTLPTSSTTRSNARPQPQVNNMAAMGPFHGRLVPSNGGGGTSFDRFLPCNSHHICNEPNASTMTVAMPQITSVQSLAGSNLYSRLSGMEPMNREPRAGSLSGESVHRPHHMPRTSSRVTVRQRRGSANSNATRRFRGNVRLVESSRRAPLSQANTYRRNLRRQFLNFMHTRLFNGDVVDQESTVRALDRASSFFQEFLVFLPQYERPNMDATASVMSLFRSSMEELIDVVASSCHTCLVEFERLLVNVFDTWRHQLYTLLCECVGSENTEVFWPQLMRELFRATISHFNSEGMQFLGTYLGLHLPMPVDSAEVFSYIRRRGDESMDTRPDEPEDQAGLNDSRSSSQGSEKANADVPQGAHTDPNQYSSNSTNSALGNTGPADSMASSNEAAVDLGSIDPITTISATESNVPVAATTTPANTPDVCEAQAPMAPPSALTKEDSATGDSGMSATNIAHIDERIFGGLRGSDSVGGPDGTIEGGGTLPPSPGPITFPIVERGSRGWHRHVPNDWVDCISHDVTLQQKPSQHTPYSDSYIAGMSSKRRKLITARKPPTDMKRLIASCMNTAMQRVGPLPNSHACVGIGSTTITGASTSAAAAAAASTSTRPAAAPSATAIQNASARAAQNVRLNQQISMALAEESVVQTASTDRVRNHVAERFKRNPDHKPEKFPKSAEFSRK